MAGSGTLGDLVAHVIDMAQFVTGELITEVAGAYLKTVIDQRELQTGDAGGGIAADTERTAELGKVTVDDTVAFTSQLSGGGVATFQGARQAWGHENRNRLEVTGSKGALKFDFEDMNVLWYYDATRPRGVRGWTRIMCTHAPDHPYVDNWWPDAHLLGYEHTFVNQAYDILCSLADQEPTVPLPDFEDAFHTQGVLAAVQQCAESRQAVPLTSVD